MQQLPDDRAASLAAADQRLEQIIARIPLRNQRMDRLEKRILASQERPAQRHDPPLPSVVNMPPRARTNSRTAPWPFRKRSRISWNKSPSYGAVPAASGSSWPSSTVGQRTSWTTPRRTRSHSHSTLSQRFGP